MDDIFYEKTLYRILRGRLRYKLGDLVLYIYEPDEVIIEESFDVYDEAYKKAYFSGVYIKEELLELLVAQDLWSPFDDREADKIEKQIEELKITAFRSFFQTKQLRGIKANIRFLEQSMVKYRSKKLCLDHISCEGVASFSRAMWVIANTTKTLDGNLYNWQRGNISVAMDYYNANQIKSSVFRKIARSDPWRSMWSLGKKQSNVFGKHSMGCTRDQLSLCGYSNMYDNVYESPESPHEKIIEDDDCLDGWFIVQRREHEKNKKQREIDDLITNPKIANSQEVFLVTPDQESANKLYELNDPISRGVVKARQQHIQEAGEVKFTEFSDVRQDIAMQQRQSYIQKVKGGR